MRKGLSALIVVACLATRSPVTGQGQPSDKFELLYRAGKPLQGLIEAKVNFLEFRKLLQAYSTELSIAKDKGRTEDEKRLIAFYDEAYQSFKDAEYLWDPTHRWQPSLQSGNRIVVKRNWECILPPPPKATMQCPSPNQVVPDPDLLPIIKKYGLETMTEGPYRIPNPVDKEPTVAMLTNTVLNFSGDLMPVAVTAMNAGIKQLTNANEFYLAGHR